MTKEDCNPRAAKFEETISKVFMALAEAVRDSTGEGWISGNQLQEATDLSPTEINDAITILKEQGYVDLLETYGTTPFYFKIVALNARGRLEFERKKSQEISKATYVKENNREWDLFICHATEDKKEVVRPLVRALVNAGFDVWYDEFTLTIGDSLRRSIDKGLSQSKYGIVILSKNFFDKNWPQTELDGLAARERHGNKVILPVWHNVDVEYIKEFSPTLADRFAVSTEKGIDYIVSEVLKVVTPSRVEQAQRAKEKSAIRGLEQTLDRLRDKDKGIVKKIVKEFEFNGLKRTFLDVLDGVAFLDLKLVFPNRYAKLQISCFENIC